MMAMIESEATFETVSQTLNGQAQNPLVRVSTLIYHSSSYPMIFMLLLPIDSIGDLSSYKQATLNFNSNWRMVIHMTLCTLYCLEQVYKY